jgi:hypothetical protein
MAKVRDRSVPRSYQYPNQHQVKENQEFADSSGPLFVMYGNIVEEEDNKMAERWQKDAQGILIFVGTSIFVSIPLNSSIHRCRPVCSLPPLRYYLQ